MLLLCLMLIALTSAADPVQQDIEIPTSYVNPDVEVLNNPGDRMVFKAPTCGYYDNDHIVTVEVSNPHNPLNYSAQGITYFTVSHNLYSGDVPANDTLCTTNTTTGHYDTSCSAATKKGDIYVYVTGNNRYRINFVVVVKFEKPKPSKRSGYVPNFRGETERRPVISSEAAAVVIELQPVVRYDSTITIPYLNATLIHLKFCPTAQTQLFTVTSIIQAADAQAKSISSQVVCETTNCDFDRTTNHIAAELYELPVSIATSQKGNYTDLYVYVVAFNGPLDSHHWPVGEFEFGVRVSP